MVLLFYLIQVFLNRPLVRLRLSAQKATDERVKLLADLIGGIRAIKAYAWEAPIMQKIARSRNIENREQLKNFCLKGFVNGFYRYTGMLFFLPIALVQIYAGEPLTPGVTYALYGVLMHTGLIVINVFNMAMQAFAEFRSFLKRLGDVLLLEEIARPTIT